MKYIYTRKGQKISVDDDIYNKFGDKKWYVSSKGYAARNFGVAGHNNIKYMHRIIMGEPVGMVIDHINRIQIIVVIERTIKVKLSLAPEPKET